MLVSIEADTNLHDFATVSEIGLGIAAGVDLVEGMTSGIAHLQLHDIPPERHSPDC